MLRCD